MAETEAPLFRSNDPVLLVGGAPVDEALLQRLARDRPLVAADSGANTAFKAGLVPDLVLGDLDSIERLDEVRRRTEVVHLPDQNTTDLEKSLACIDAPAILGLGFLGARFDHSLAALHAIAACTKPREIMLAGADDVVLRVRGGFRQTLPIGLRFSVWPLGRQRFRRSHGLRWPLDGLTMHAGCLIGTSNETDASDVAIEAGEGTGYLVILPIEVLDRLLASWPASLA